MHASMNATPNQRILLAEDDDAMRVYLERALVNAGYAVDAVDRGTDALPLLESGDYELLLSDIVMPEMDGIELAQRCNELSPHTKVMFITGFAAVTLKASREQPNAKVLSKPFHLRDLVGGRTRAGRPCERNLKLELGSCAAPGPAIWPACPEGTDGAGV